MSQKVLFFAGMPSVVSSMVQRFESQEGWEATGAGDMPTAMKAIESKEFSIIAVGGRMPDPVKEKVAAAAKANGATPVSFWPCDDNALLITNFELAKQGKPIQENMYCGR